MTQYLLWVNDNPEEWKQVHAPKKLLLTTDNLNFVLGRATSYLDVTYGENNWSLSHSGQFIHKYGTGGSGIPIYIETLGDEFYEQFKDNLPIGKIRFP